MPFSCTTPGLLLIAQRIDPRGMQANCICAYGSDCSDILVTTVIYVVCRSFF